MKTLGRVLAAAAIAGFVSGCSASVNLAPPEPSGPTCLDKVQGRPKDLNGTLVLAAQSVQTASWVPCLRPLPAGWTFHSFDARSGRSRVALDLGSTHDNALVVTLTRACDVRTAARMPTDRAGVRRYEDVAQSPGHYTGRREYLFPGGCITMSFDVHGVSAAQAAGAAAQSVGLVSRADLRDYVLRYSRGRFRLDPLPRS